MSRRQRLSSAYLALAPTGELYRRAEAARALLSPCRLCPHQCGVDRPAGEQGRCGLGGDLRLASVGPHFGEEAPLVGRNGSGTLFLAGCNLACVFCQNHELSHGCEGQDVAPAEVARALLALQARGCHNLNFVTPTHVVPQLLEALALAADQGLQVPLVYNCGGYESVETLRLLDGVFDLYLPDFKYADAAVAEALSGCADYPTHARAALREMHRQVGELVCDETGLAQRGVMVRHLVLPGGLAGTAEVARFLADELSRDVYVNIMDQYRPCFRAAEHEALSRPLSSEEYEAAVAACRSAGLRRLEVSGA